jgi:hypothetical protein
MPAECFSIEQLAPTGGEAKDARAQVRHGGVQAGVFFEHDVPFAPYGCATRGMISPAG